MKDIPDEIEKMEQIAENLDDWAKKESHNINISNLDYYIIAAKTMEGFNAVLEWLRYKNKPHEAEKLQDEAAELLRFAKIVGQKDSNLKIDESFCFRDLARTQAIVLSKHLRHIVEMAIKELSTEKAAETELKKKGGIKKLLKIIGAVVGFLAALLTILHLLGWLEPIKDFVVKMIWHK